MFYIYIQLYYVNKKYYAKQSLTSYNRYIFRFCIYHLLQVIIITKGVPPWIGS